MNSRDRFLSAAQCQPVDQTPVWFMRQAGRYLPEYKALKNKYGFLKLAQTPELATEVTLQPITRFPQLDAAILFSDILVIPEALGQPYSFREQGGIQMAYSINTQAKVDALSPEAVSEKLEYVPQALHLLKKELKSEKALLGFGGSPFTLAAYMIEGGSNHHFDIFKQVLDLHPIWLDKLLEKLAESLITYFSMQIKAGADAIQIFDSWGHLCTPDSYEILSLKWIKQIIEALPSTTPIILFSKHPHPPIPKLLETGASVLSLGPSCQLAKIRAQYPGQYALQGNLDPQLLTGPIDIVRTTSLQLLQSMQGHPGHILNLGHGLTPQAKIENIEAILELVQAPVLTS